ncbi:MAG: polysaccharide biosynthesis C-terminal domain-containing protein [Oscillospiraceae bacterium]|nr:polysaccharide biosynthesis C-terminal domain-containing protein [Oscillospiraceae bacterium]
MASKSSLKKNLSMQTAYQILSTCIPLITAPFLARTLGAAQLGVFSFTNANALYFIRLSMLGTVNHGTRVVASVREDSEKLNEKYSNIYFIQIITTLISVVLYILYLLFFCKENKEIALIQMIPILGCFLNVTWLFFGLEKISFTVVRNFFIRIATVSCILLFIRRPDDLWKYTLIMAAGTFLGEFVVWVTAPKYARFQKPSWDEILNNLKPILILFIPIIATSFYHTMDKTMLGLLSTDEESGFYYNSDKVINIPIAILQGIGTVMLPRITSLIASGRKEEGNKLFLLSLEGVGVFSIALSCGIAAVSKEFTPVFFGPGYDRCIALTVVLAPVLIVKSISSSLRTQYLIPYHMDDIYIRSVVAGAVINVIVNLILMPRYGAMGAVIGTLAAEIVACTVQYLYIRKGISIGKTILRCAVYVLIGLVMIASVRLIANVLNARTIIKLIVEILAGAAVYSSLCLIYWKLTDNEMYGEIFGTLFRSLARKFKH